MIGRTELRKRAVGALSAFPVYRAMPLQEPRDALAILYLVKNASASEACRYIDNTGRIPTQRASAVLLGGRAAFQAGRDDLLDQFLVRAKSMCPGQAELAILQSDIAAFRGNYTAALRHAEHARLLAPASPDAAARSVRLHYLAADQDAANGNALNTLKRFSQSLPVLWAASKHCATEAQFDALHAIWRAGLRGARDLSRTIRPLGNAALRVERFVDAAGLYAEAALVELSGKGLNRAIKEKRLKGKGGLSVISDVREVLERANIPFFLAAGTALGIIRDGRPLDHDNDIDVGVFEQNWDRERLEAAFLQHPNFDFDNPHTKSRKIGLIHRGGAAIDLFCFYKEKESFYHDAVFVRWENAPFELQEKQLPSGPVMLPSPEDVYLTENYGDWRTPDPGFDAFVQGPNVEVIWPEYFAVHRVRQGYKRVCAKDMEGAKREFSAAGSVLRETDAGRQLANKLGCKK